MKIEYNNFSGFKDINKKFIDNGAVVKDNVLIFEDSVADKVTRSYIEDGLTREMAKYTVEYFISLYAIKELN